jgi:hypothetical protein
MKRRRERSIKTERERGFEEGIKIGHTYLGTITGY